jgi:hypothetical protein
VRHQGIDELGNFDPYGLEGGAGLTAQMVHTAVDVRVFPAVKPENGFDDYLRLLRSGCVVEVDQRMPMYLLLQDGEVLPDPLDIERWGRCEVQLCISDPWVRNHGFAHRAPRRSRTSPSSSFRTGSRLTSAMTSAAKA